MLKLVEGGFYRCRNGVVVGPMRRMDDDVGSGYCWNVEGGVVGRWSESGEDGFEQGGVVDGAWDLVGSGLEGLREPFGLLGDDLRKALLICGGPWEVLGVDGEWRDVVVGEVGGWPGLVYRKKPGCGGGGG